MKKILMSLLLFGLFGLSIDTCKAKGLIDQKIILRDRGTNTDFDEAREIDLHIEMRKLSDQIDLLRKKIDPIELENFECNAEFHLKYTELLSRFSELLNASWKLSGEALMFGYDFSVFFAYDILYARAIPRSLAALDKAIDLVDRATIILTKMIDYASGNAKPSPKKQPPLVKMNEKRIPQLYKNGNEALCSVGFKHE